MSVNWSDVLMEATEVYALLTELLITVSGHPEGIERDCNIRNLQAAIVSCNRIIAGVNARMEKKPA